MTAERFVIEELVEADLPAVVELCRVALDLPEDATEAEAIVTRLRAARQSLGFVARDAAADTTRPTGAEPSGPAPLGVLLGSVDHDDPALGHVDLVAVRPAARRRGIGRALIGAAETALAGLGAGEVLLSGNPPHYAWPGIDVRYTPAVCAAPALGYTHDTTAWNMTADLADTSPGVRDTGPAQARLAAADVAVRRATAADLGALAALLREHFSPTWIGEVADSVDRPGAGCHLAVRGGEVLGFAAYGSSRPSWFGPMGTAPAVQGLGIGAVLLRRCLIDQRAAGHRSAQISWVGPVRFYSGVAGARIERVFFLYRKRL